MISVNMSIVINEVPITIMKEFVSGVWYNNCYHLV